jgi:hypothetical protein
LVSYLLLRWVRRKWTWNGEWGQAISVPVIIVTTITNELFLSIIVINLYVKCCCLTWFFSCFICSLAINVLLLFVNGCALIENKFGLICHEDFLLAKYASCLVLFSGTGFYETRLAYYAWRGAKGYRFSSIPDY